MERLLPKAPKLLVQQPTQLAAEAAQRPSRFGEGNTFLFQKQSILCTLKQTVVPAQLQEHGTEAAAACSTVKTLQVILP